MHRIKASEVVVDFPLYGVRSRSLKNKLLRSATGGAIERDAADRVIVRALDHITFELRDGDRAGLVGHNGSGKSTLLRVIAGTYEPVNGSIEVVGNVVSLLSITFGMDPEATGYENIFLRGAVMGLKPVQIESLAEEICEFSELGDYIHMPLRTYSSGMSIRLAYAISTSVRADILLMDEWLSAVDADFSVKAQKRLTGLIDQAKILVLASHSTDVIRANCNRIFRLEHGRIIAETAGGFRPKPAGIAASSNSAEERSSLSAERDGSFAHELLASSGGVENRLQAWSARGQPSYDEDNLVTWLKSVDFLLDFKFLSAYDRAMASGHRLERRSSGSADAKIKWRVAICCWAARHATHLSGDFVECGVNTGIYALAICNYVSFNATSKTFWLFDTFEGIPIEQVSDLEKAQGRMAESATLYPPCYDIALENFSPFPAARLVKGKVPGTLKATPIEKVAYLSLDMSIAFPERAALEHFWALLVPGAVVVIGAYGWEPYREVKRSLDAFAQERDLEIMLLPTGQGLLIKP